MPRWTVLRFHLGGASAPASLPDFCVSLFCAQRAMVRSKQNQAATLPTRQRGHKRPAGAPKLVIQHVCVRAHACSALLVPCALQQYVRWCSLREDRSLRDVVARKASGGIVVEWIGRLSPSSSALVLFVLSSDARVVGVLTPRAGTSPASIARTARRPG